MTVPQEARIAELSTRLEEATSRLASSAGSEKGLQSKQAEETAALMAAHAEEKGAILARMQQMEAELQEVGWLLVLLPAACWSCTVCLMCT